MCYVIPAYRKRLYRRANIPTHQVPSSRMRCSILHGAALIRELVCGSSPCSNHKIPRLRCTEEESLHRARDDEFVFLIAGIIGFRVCRAPQRSAPPQTRDDGTSPHRWRRAGAVRNGMRVSRSPYRQDYAADDFAFAHPVEDGVYGAQRLLLDLGCHQPTRGEIDALAEVGASTDI